MIIEDNLKLIYSDTPVPDIFITEYLPQLSDKAVKFYVYVLLLARTKRVISESDIEARIATDKEGVKVILTELALHNLISFTERGFVIEDIKEAEIKKIYKPRTSATPIESGTSEQNDIRNKVMADISKTFFSGLMSPSWYYEIENWFTLYGFDPQVVYALFTECKRRRKLDSKAYISKVASNWSEHGIKTYDDLNRYSTTFDRVAQIARKVGTKLRKNITEYDEKIISNWVEKMNYDFDVIEIALKKTSKLANPNLEYANKMLEEWFSLQLRTAEDVNLHDEKMKARFAGRRSSGSASVVTASKNVGNFEQRKYSDDYIEMMIDDLSELTDKT